MNDRLADVCREAPDRFRFVAVVPLLDRRVIAKEMDRALSNGAVGIGITTTYGGRPLDAPELRDFWREASRLGLAVLVHPTFPADGPIGDHAGLYLAIGYPAETAMAATRLMLAGVLEECPDVRVVWSHCGGTLLMALDRIDRAARRGYPSLTRRPSSYFGDQCFVDTVSSHAAAATGAYAAFGASGMVFGTDEPNVRDGTREAITILRSRDWPGEDIDRILGGNAETLIGKFLVRRQPLEQ
jgi:predicted TIM-barrel fold metal-dependent hydrolase